MVLENGGVNEAQLFAAGFPEFILSFVCKHLSHDIDYLSSGRIKNDTNALAVWLLCFTLSHSKPCLLIRVIG
ncbi:hypothetical protein BDZ94DRAFT_1270042 [Collybia nuda]|uniref:Uncharacterized protein n=1 Tax=Collybia nuda TaxID=64659 RepID=A0A9P5XZU5_9AGAR|nr:hypothetical protein BDZ94DRAFT_1270042 [Collybia nuda]